jgi:hypothetical protein
LEGHVTGRRQVDLRTGLDIASHMQLGAAGKAPWTRPSMIDVVLIAPALVALRNSRRLDSVELRLRAWVSRRLSTRGGTCGWHGFARTARQRGSGRPSRHVLPAVAKRLNDIVVLSTERGEFRYRVVSTKVVCPQAVEVLDATEEETRYPFVFVGAAPTGSSSARKGCGLSDGLSHEPEWRAGARQPRSGCRRQANPLRSRCW